MHTLGASSTWRCYGSKNSFIDVDILMMQSLSEGNHSAYGVFISTRDQYTFGLLFLRKSKRKNKTIIIRKIG
jgi:hypothetical protein